MKKQFILVFGSFIIWHSAIAQIVGGQIVEMLESKDAIKIPRFANASFLIEWESEKIKTENGKTVAPYEVEIGTSGKFEVDTGKINGSSLSLYLKSQNYAPIILRNIPKEKLVEFVRIIPITRIMHKAAGSFDSLWLEMDEKKTFKRKQLILVDESGKRKITLRKMENSFTAPSLERHEPIFDSGFFYEFVYE
nr:hypothetical protein [uncultured Allomuricauda sp.]